MTHTPRTRAALNLPGCCPVCGEHATRKVTVAAGVGRETYRCPVDGDVGYVFGREHGIEAPAQGLSMEPVVQLRGFAHIVGPATRAVAAAV